MRLVFIGPSVIDDPHVHRLMQDRIERIKANPKEYLSFESTDELEVCIIVPTSYGISENELLDGSWPGLREFHDVHLPILRDQIKVACEGEDVMVHVDLGDDLSTLYAAYFATQAGAPMTVAFHMPTGEGVPFNVGGKSDYARFRPFQRRFMGRVVMAAAQNVLVDLPGLQTGLHRLFSLAEDYPILLDPFSPAASEPVQPALFSETGG